MGFAHSSRLNGIVSPRTAIRISDLWKMAKEDLELQSSKGVGIEWTIHPVRRNWKVSAGVVLFLLILCVAIYLSFESAAYLVPSILILVCSLDRFFLPTTYILQEDRVIVRSLFRRSSRDWNYFKSYYPDKNGVLLSPFAYPSKLENFRGIYVRFDNNKPEVVAFVKEKLGKQKSVDI